MWPFHRRREEDFSEEIEAHLAHEADRLIADGVSPERARAAARRAFGNPTTARERFYESRRLMSWEALRQDVRYALRGVRRAPGFAAIVVLTLALGIGANTAVFSVVNAVLLRPLPYSDSDRLVRIVERTTRAEAAGPLRPFEGGLNALELDVLRSSAGTLTHIGIYRDVAVTLTGNGETVRLQGARVSPAVIAALGVPPLLGRTFDAREDSAPLVVLAHATWQREFDEDPGIVGRAVTLESLPHVVIGVMPPGFEFPDPAAQLWLPTALPAGRLALLQRMVPLARVGPGVPLEKVEAEVAALVQRVRRDSPPQGTGFTNTFTARALRDDLVSTVRPALLVLVVAVGLVLLIACVNVANLLLARRGARQQEIALRLALGASRGRLIQQLITESVLLAATGAIAGTGLALAGLRLLKVVGATLPRQDLVAPPSLPRLADVAVDLPVLVFTLAVSIVTAVTFGLAPAVYQTRRTLMHPGTAGPPTSGAQRALVVAELGLAMMLLVAGGLLIQSFVKLSNVNPGYDPSHVLTFTVVTPPGRYSGPQQAALAEDLVARLEAVPGVLSAGYTELLPMVRFRTSGAIARGPAGQDRLPPASGSASDPRPIDTFTVSRGFLAAMGIRVVSGRGFEERDAAGRPRVVLINRTLARTGFLGPNPIGQTIVALKQTWEVIGVLEDIRQTGLNQDPVPQVFFEMRQTPAPGVTARVNYVVLRTDGEPSAIAPTVRSLVRQLDPLATADLVAPMAQLVSNSVSRPRLYAMLMGIFAFLAATLASVGMYGVMAYAVAERTREIGIRMALGAQRANVMGLVIRQGLMMTSAGLIIGLAGAAFAAQYLETLLFGLTPLDPTTFVAVSTMFVATAMLASYLPARRATAIDPLVALRAE